VLLRLFWKDDDAVGLLRRMALFGVEKDVVHLMEKRANSVNNDVFRIFSLIMMERDINLKILDFGRNN
jgi:hypothetical protein